MNLYQKYSENSVPLFVHIILCILALAIWLLFASLALPFLFIFNVFKWTIAGWILYNRLGKLLASEDAVFMHESEHNRNYSVCLFLLKGSVDIEKFRKLFHDRVLTNNGHISYQRLKQCVERKYGRYVWSDEENFDHKRHIILYDGTQPKNEDELRTLFVDMISKPIPKDISPWQCVLVPMSSCGRFAFFVRAHHIIGDGISMVNLFSKVMDNKPQLLKPSEKLLKKYKSNGLKRLLHAICTGPLKLLTVALSYANNPFQRTEEIKSEQKVAWTSAIDLTKIKEAKNKIGATINDVVTGCLAGAVRRYIIATSGKCTEDIQIVISINTRPPSTLLKDNLPLENNSTGVFFHLPVKAETILERVEESKKRMNNIKNSSEFLVFGFIFNQVIANLPEFLGRFTVNSINRHSCFILSNVPGPLNKMVIGGDEVECIMVFPPLVGGTGMSTAIFSYNDTIRLNVKVDTSVFPDPKVFADNFQLEVDELLDLCAKKVD